MSCDRHSRSDSRGFSEPRAWCCLQKAEVWVPRIWKGLPLVSPPKAPQTDPPTLSPFCPPILLPSGSFRSCFCSWGGNYWKQGLWPARFRQLSTPVDGGERTACPWGLSPQAASLQSFVSIWLPWGLVFLHGCSSKTCAPASQPETLIPMAALPFQLDALNTGKPEGAPVFPTM